MQGTLKYNGFNFPTAVKVRARAEPVADSTNRFTKYVRYRIEVEFVIYPGIDAGFYAANPGESNLFPDTLTTADGDPNNVGEFGYEGLRKVLTERGKNFIFTGKGFGYDFNINTTKTDVMYGPVPQFVTWDPIAGNKAVRVVWAIEVSVSDCVPIRSTTGRISEFNYQTDYSITDGLTVRTVTGTLEISLINNAAGFPTVLADYYRNQVDVQVPLGFKRTSANFTQSKDFRTLTYRIVDSEVPSDNPMHNGLTKEDVTHEITSSGSTIGTQYMVSVRGSYEVAPGANKGLAWAAFLWVVQSRRKNAFEGVLATGERGDGRKKYPHSFPVRISVSDEVYGRGITFDVAWIVFATIKESFKVGGLFEKVQGADWASWRASMQNVYKTWDNRGHAGLTPQLNSTGVVGLCSLNYPQQIIDARRDTRTNNVGRIFEGECPPKEASWVSYMPKVSLEMDHKSIPMHPTGGVDGYAPKILSPSSDGNNLPYAERSVGSRRLTKVYTSGQTRYLVRFSGVATRRGYKIPRPELISYGGVKVSRPIGKSMFNQAEVDLVEGCRTYQAYWETLYELEGKPTGDLIESVPNFKEFPR